MANLDHRRQRSFGFTLIELMIVASIISILATIAIPKFADLIRKSKEGATKGNLGSVRSALSIYYADMEGQSADDANALTIGGKYLTRIPTIYSPYYHPDTTMITSDGHSGPGAWTLTGDNGTLSYIMGSSWQAPTWLGTATVLDVGSVFIMCTDTDTKGTSWTLY
jgi:prepilin-type N-terminal cleavage/methylation domain-containing protein